jgi:hypothetical protein
VSKAKPWPTVANRHRIESILKAGEIKVEAKTRLNLLQQLRSAIMANNIPLALAITSAVEAQARFISEAADTIISTLESAPSDVPPNGRNPQGEPDDP